MSVMVVSGFSISGDGIMYSPSVANTVSMMTLNQQVNPSFNLSSSIDFGPVSSGAGSPNMDGYFGFGFAFDIYSTGDQTYPYQYCAVYISNVSSGGAGSENFYVTFMISQGNRVGATGYNAKTTKSAQYLSQSSTQTLAVKRFGSYIQVLLNNNPVVFPTWASDLGSTTYSLPSWVPSSTYVFDNVQENALITNTVGLFANYTGTTPPTGASADYCVWNNILISDNAFVRANDFNLIDLSVLGCVENVQTPTQFSDAFNSLANWQ